MSADMPVLEPFCGADANDAPPLPLLVRTCPLEPPTISVATRLRKVGDPLEPFGAEKTVLAVWLARVAESVPLAVTGDPLTVRMDDGKDSPTLVTVPVLEVNGPCVALAI